jgi:hypothetical protein
MMRLTTLITCFLDGQLQDGIEAWIVARIKFDFTSKKQRMYTEVYHNLQIMRRTCYKKHFDRSLLGAHTSPHFFHDDVPLKYRLF